MELNNLKKNPGATHRSKRVGRGPGSGLGKTSGRGENGQKSRSGASIPAVFEGGQTPLFRRLHKRGFSNARFKVRYATVNVEDLNIFNDGDVVTPELLKEKGIVKKQLSGIKVLGNGTINKKLTIKAHRFTQSALVKIEESGSKAEVI
ncbi:MAG: 50S ribosomal protein L15 [bacterium]|nr:50S ribosomal protein L15 [bacterium]